MMRIHNNKRVGFAAASSLLFLLSATSSTTFTLGIEFKGIPRCGDCWCITDDDNGNVCPSNTTGITDTFSEDQNTDGIYKSFELTNPDEDFLKLKSSSGGTCYPFASDDDKTMSMEPIYPEAGSDKCVTPDDNDENDDDMVCAYVYDPSSTTCQGRKYEIKSFSSATEAKNTTNAAIVHEGACGVCSSAQDFGTRIMTYGNLEAESIKCATSYTFKGNFTELVNCFEDLGFTKDCATLWAHFGASNSKTCASFCIPSDNGVVLNGPAPECAPSECLDCQLQFRDDFDDLAGIEMNKAGITERIPQDCDDFFPVVHDPCMGIDDDGSDGGDGAKTDEMAGEEETAAPDSDSSSDSSSSLGRWDREFIILTMAVINAIYLM